MCIMCTCYIQVAKLITIFGGLTKFIPVIQYSAELTCAATSEPKLVCISIGCYNRDKAHQAGPVQFKATIIHLPKLGRSP